MELYSPLLEKTRLPQPSLQRFAVISIFHKLRSSPPHLGSDSDPGREAITQCLHSTSPAVVDQSVRELCRLVKESTLDISHGLLELQSALEGSDPRFVGVFVKGLGFLVRLGFQKNTSSFRFHSSETHPFVKVLSCRAEVHSELVQQVLILMVQNKQFGMVEVCEFLRPFVNFCIIRTPLSATLLSFTMNLVSSVASLCCSFPQLAMPVIKMLMGCLKFLPQKNAKDIMNIPYFVECIVDAFIVVLGHLVDMGLLVSDAQLCSLELLDITFQLRSSIHKHVGEAKAIFDISSRLLTVQRDLGLSFIAELSSVFLSLFIILIESELEHEQLSILKLLLFLLKWKSENEYVVLSRSENVLDQELLFIFPIINLVSSPSGYVKQAATDVLSVLGKLSINLRTETKKVQTRQEGIPFISRPEYIIYRLLQHLWSQDQNSLYGSFYLHFLPFGVPDINEAHHIPSTWTSIVRKYSLSILERRKSAQFISQSQHLFLTDTPSLLGATASVLVVHETLGSSAVDLLAASGSMDPRLGVPLLLLILFYNYIFSGRDKDIEFHDMLLKLVGLLPSLASRPAMIPLVVQTILPMLRKDAKPVLYSTATRLLCKTWEINDRVFGSLQGVLLPEGFAQFTSERTICISMALSIRDVCRRNPDRGVDLILSISACIECQDSMVQALGFESLSHLCEADVIDFYTAWDVIAKHVVNYSADPVIACSVCLLLKYGAMDAEAYPDSAMNVMQILWEVGTSRDSSHGSQWAKARLYAFEGLTHYDVVQIQRSIPEFKEQNVELLVSETDPEVLRALEKLEVKIIEYEHTTRRRLVKEKRVSGNKIEKLLDVFPQVVFAPGKDNRTREMPGAALFCMPLPSKDRNIQGMSKGVSDLHARYENEVLEIASSLQLSRNILIALLSLQSWKVFMQRWMRAHVMFLDAKAPVTGPDKISQAADSILKSLKKIVEGSIPRSAENIPLAMAALCMVLPPSVHAVKSATSKFLGNWLFQSEHEYRQWSAAISLGLISNCLHVTDHKQKSENINALLEVLFCSKSTLVKGACGVGLGFSCQDLLRTVDAEAEFHLDRKKYEMQEADLLGKTVRALSMILHQLTQSSSDVLESLSAYFPPATDNADSGIYTELLGESFDSLEEDIWGVAGLVLGLGSCVGAIYRAGSYDAVIKIKSLITSWIPCMSQSVHAANESYGTALSVGSCLALPVIVAFCQRVELVEDAELDYLLDGYRDVISELVSVKKSGIQHQSLLTASCVGAGTLLSCILNEGVHSVEVERVKDLLALFKKSYSGPHPHLIHLGGMLGVVNALGSSAGTLIDQYTSISLQMVSDQKESSYITGPLLSYPALEPDLMSLIQDMFLAAQDFDDHQLQQYAAWAVSFLRHYLWSRGHGNESGNQQKDAVGFKAGSGSFPENSLVMKLSLWLTHLNHPEAGTTSRVYTVATVLRCLTHAHRLPPLDWGAIIRRCMRHEGQVAELLPLDSSFKKGISREECLQFSLVHANNFDPLLRFLDELSDLSRFKTLELNLQSFLLFHLADLIKIFSGSRLEKLFDDVANFLYWLVSLDQIHSQEEKSLLRVSCWKGICLCLDETSSNSEDYMSKMETCMEALFSSLPILHSVTSPGMGQQYLADEWHEAVNCLGKARQGWLLDLLEVSEMDFMERVDRLPEDLKKIQVRARLVRIGSIPFIELGKLKAYVLNSRSQEIWDVLVEITATLHLAEGNVKRQWLIDALEISCMSRYPSTALQFLGLLSGSCSKFMPFLIVDRHTVLSDLPVTLTSLLLDTSWEVIAETALSFLWTSTERVYDWVTRGDNAAASQPIDGSEEDIVVFLLQVMHQTCVSLKDYLPPEKQLVLANMTLPPPEFTTLPSRN